MKAPSQPLGCYRTAGEALAAAGPAGSGASAFVPAALVAQKAKTVADSVFAALEELHEDGAAQSGDVAVWLEALGAALGKGVGHERVRAARDLAREGSTSRAVAAAFVADPLRSKPLAFYTWSEALTDIFHQDRMLQSELERRPGIEAVARA
ncbi:MAG: hypothetical protein ACRENE_06805, partial [Polyangiaceae bacterium]